MKDAMGRGFWERRREKSFERSQTSSEERREELRKAFATKSGENGEGHRFRHCICGHRKV